MKYQLKNIDHDIAWIGFKMFALKCFHVKVFDI